ncbi:MAG: hypothetical protein K2Q12_09870, partial [Rickettsiales bacterium]|nr:hypothetical protein [Rickettsiales bacterium]
MSDASPIPPAAATDITRTSHLRWPIFALIAMGLTGLGGTGYYFIYQKEEIATRRRQDASPVAYFQSRQNGEQPTNEAEEAELASSLEMPEAPADVATSVASNLVTENVASTPAPNEQALAEATDNAQASTDVLDRMAAQEQKIEALEARLDAAEQEMQGLSDALAQSAASGSDEAASSDRADLLIQFYRVRQRAINAQPFSEALAIL